MNENIKNKLVIGVFGLSVVTVLLFVGIWIWFVRLLMVGV